MAAKRAVVAKRSEEPTFAPAAVVGPGVGTFSPRDEPPGWVPPAPERRRRREASRTIWLPHILAGFLAPLISLVLLFSAHGALNSTTPDKDSARIMFTLTLIVGLGIVGAAVALGRLKDRELSPWFWIGSVLGLVAAAAVLYNSLWDIYGDDAAFTYLVLTIILTVVGLGLVGSGGLLVMLHKGRTGGPIALGFAVSIAGGAAVVALLFLMNLDDQASTARAINEAEPGFGILVGGAALALATWVRRWKGE